MVSVGDTAPEFSAPLANGDVETFTLSEALEDGPVVLAFFPGAFTSVCTGEMRTFRDRIENLTAEEATLYGISTDSPFALNEFRDQNDLPFDLVSDANREVVDLYDVAFDFDAFGLEDLAKRAVFVVNTDGEVTYAWVSDDPGVEPDYEEVEAAAATAD
ncbi:MAG: redoxin domain-containing protein [Haloarculaceae archaeon]|jgi:peroxiredoxin